jgi:hypothetical protein
LLHDLDDFLQGVALQMPPMQPVGCNYSDSLVTCGNTLEATWL